ELLLRGTLVSGASRFRWAGWEADLDSLHEVLATFPDPEPSRPFAANRCVRATLRGGRQAIEIPREAGTRKGLFQRQTFWDVMMDVVSATPASYLGYSYREKADRFQREFSTLEAARLRDASGLVKFSTLSELIRSV